MLEPTVAFGGAVTLKTFFQVMDLERAPSRARMPIMSQPSPPTSFHPPTSRLSWATLSPRRARSSSLRAEGASLRSVA